MRKSIITICLLFVSLVSVWTYKINNPVNEPQALAIETDKSWWEDESSIPIADKEWTLDPEIPSNYIPVMGEDELYMEVDDDGYIVAYHKREQMNDGTWVWEEVNPDIPSDYEPVEGKKDIYKVTDEKGNVTYLKYIRNKDDTFAFVEVDKDGNEILNEEIKNGSIPANFIHVTENIYAVYNENGVLLGYKQRIQNNDGSYSWVECEEPKDKNSASTTTGTITSGINSSVGASGNNGSGKGQYGIISGGGGGVTNTTTSNNSDGTYTEVETYTESKTTGGYKITYETKITKVYSSDGKLKSTKKDGPNEISRVKVTESNSDTPDTSKIASTIDAEIARVSGSVKFNTSLANELFAELNAERVSNGLPKLTMSSSSNQYKLAQLVAADMAIYNHGDYESPLYGTLGDLMNRYSIGGSAPAENLWRSSPKTAAQINTRFQTLDTSKNNRMSTEYTSVGIAIVEKNGYMYIAEIYFK